MSSDLTIYVGVYLRVYLPKEDYEVQIRVCSKCGIRQSNNFCSECGAETLHEVQQRMISFYDLCESIFELPDVFATAQIVNDDYEIVLANNFNQPGFAYINTDCDGECKMPVNDASGDWVTLMNALSERGIKFDREYGIVTYWS